MSWLFGKHLDEQPDPDEDVSPLCEENSDAGGYENGVTFARKMIDWSRRNYAQHGHSSFQESIETGGEAWHRIVQREEDLARQGHTERQSRLDYARGARSQYD